MPNKTYTFTLNRAHKIVERLKTHASELVKEAELLASPLSVRSQEEAGSQKRAADNALNALINLEAYTTVLATIRTLRQAIATANHTSGVDNLLALQNKQTQILSAYKRVLDSVAPASSVAWDQIPAVASEYTRYSLETLNADQLSGIREAIASTQMKLHATSDSVSDANRTSSPWRSPKSTRALRVWRHNNGLGLGMPERSARNVARKGLAHAAGSILA